MSKIFITHPFASDPDRDCSLVVQVTRRFALPGHVPLAREVLFGTLSMNQRNGISQ